MKKMSSLQSKISLGVLAPIFIFGTIASGFVFLQMRETLIESKKLDYLDLLNAHAYQIEQLATQGWDTVDTLAKWELTNEALVSTSAAAREELNTEFSHANIGNRFDDLYLLDEGGRVVASSNTDLIGQSFYLHRYYQQSVQGRRFLEIALGFRTNELRAYFSHPVIDESGAVIGVIAGKMKPDIAASVFEQVAQTFSTVYLVDTNGVVIFPPSPDQYRPLSKLDQLTINDILQHQRFPSDQLSQPLGLTDHYQQVKTYSQPTSVEITRNGERRLLYVSEIAKLKLYFVVEKNLDEITRSSFRNSLFVTGMVLLAAVAAYLAIHILILIFLRPVDDVIEGARQISKGNLDHRLSVHTGDEFENIAQEFNAMADEIQSIRRDIENKVQERIEKLQKMNDLMVDRENRMIELKKKIEQLEGRNDHQA